MRILLLAALILTFGRSSYADETLVEPNKVGEMMEKTVIELNVNKTGAAVKPLFFGANRLFWAQDKAAIRDGTTEMMLKKMKCKLLRFPGGTVADNYLWREHRLYNPNTFPFTCKSEHR